MSENVQVWQPHSEKKRFITLANFEEITGCRDAEEFVNMKAIMGDKGDNVPGAVGIGAKTAIQYLRSELKTQTAKGEPTKAYVAVNQWINDPDGFDLSKQLVDLRHISIKTPFKLVSGVFDQNALMQEFLQLGFNSILGEIDNFLSPFKKAFT